MQNTEYLDPDNVMSIKEEIKNAPNLGSLKAIVDRVYPNWIKGVMTDYSNDYPELKKNWYEVCEKNNTSPKQIMLVDFISFDPQYSLISIFSEILTLSGFCVRSKQEIFPCMICEKAIPQVHIYNLLQKNGNSKIPRVWRTSCEDCK